MILTLVNPILDEFWEGYFSFDLPSVYYFTTPLVMLNPNVLPNKNRGIIKIDGNEIIRDSFLKRGNVKDIIINAEIETPGYEGICSEDYFDRGYIESRNIIFPDKFRWGEILKLCHGCSDNSQTNLFPVGINSEENIITFLNKHIKK